MLNCSKIFHYVFRFPPFPPKNTDHGAQMIGSDTSENHHRVCSHLRLQQASRAPPKAFSGLGTGASFSARKLLGDSRILIPYSVNNHSEHILLTLLVRVCVFVQGVRVCLCVCSWVLVCHITTGTHIRTHFMHRKF